LLDTTVAEAGPADAGSFGGGPGTSDPASVGIGTVVGGSTSGVGRRDRSASGDAGCVIVRGSGAVVRRGLSRPEAAPGPCPALDPSPSVIGSIGWV
jgi:hypothetical protein